MESQLHVEAQSANNKLPERETGGQKTPMPDNEGVLHPKTNGRTWRRSDSPLISRKSSLGTVSSLEDMEATKHMERNHEPDNSSQEFQSTSDRHVVGLTSHMIVVFCFLFLSAAIAILACPKYVHSEKRITLPNGDHICKCKDFPGDTSCFEVRDVADRMIYKSHRQNRTLGFFQCSPDAPETKRTRCVGEYAFSHDSTVLWNMRLYLDNTDGTYSIISGPQGAAHLDAVPRVRHMLSDPYNWIIAFEPIPRNSHPESGVYVDGEVHVQKLS